MGTNVNESATLTSTPARKPKGFAAISKERQREIASLGGKRSHQLGVGHTFSPEEAREAGRRGGLASRGGRGKLPLEQK